MRHAVPRDLMLIAQKDATVRHFLELWERGYLNWEQMLVTMAVELAAQLDWLKRREVRALQRRVDPIEQAVMKATPEQLGVPVERAGMSFQVPDNWPFEDPPAVPMEKTAMYQAGKRMAAKVEQAALEVISGAVPEGSCSECFGTGRYKGFGGPCSRGCPARG